MNTETDFSKPSDKMADVLIVGAGLSGLMAANHLQAQGVRVAVLDKSRGVGGRLATRRMGTAVLDHGAQYFTARKPEFQAFVQQWEAEGLVSRWFEKPGGIALDRDAAGNEPTAPEPCYMVPGGMTRLAKKLAESLDADTLHLNSRAVSIQREAGGFLVQTEGGEQYQAERIILTAPLPQSLALLTAKTPNDCGIEITPALLERLRAVTYDPCVALLAVLDRPSQVPPPGGLLPDSEIVGWVADNYQKGVSPNGYGLTVQASPNYSKVHYEASDADLAEVLIRETAPWLGDAVILEWQMKRWAYALARHALAEPFVTVSEAPALLLAGDAFGGPRMENAALSGLAAAQVLLADYKPDAVRV